MLVDSHFVFPLRFSQYVAASHPSNTHPASLLFHPPASSDPCLLNSCPHYPCPHTPRLPLTLPPKSVFIKSKNREECRNYKCVDAYPDIKEHIKYYSTPNPRSNEFDWDTKTCMYILNTTNTSLTDLYQNRILAGSSYNSQEFIDTQAWADLIVIAILSLAAVYWYYWLNRKAEKIDRLHATAQDFAVEITDPPVDMKDPDVYYVSHRSVPPRRGGLSKPHPQ